ncbi:MAG: protein kinase domain-containing protein, partial [Spirillospora sp.]
RAAPGRAPGQREPGPGARRPGQSPEYVWLRQIGLREDTPEGEEALKALSAEHDLLAELGGCVPGLPRPRQAPEVHPGGRTATLVVTWPSSRSGTPCPALDTMIEPGGGPMDPFRMFGLLGGLAEVCKTLTGLHGRGIAHRGLTPSGIILLDHGSLALRDLGLAARPCRANEGASDHQAPEQRQRQGRAIGPHTDVYRLAALTYHVLTGGPPHSRAPLPVGGQVPDLPEQLGRTLDTALAADPSERPDARSLEAAFKAARKALLPG